MNNLGLRGFVSFVVWCQIGTWYGHQVLYKNNKKDYFMYIRMHNKWTRAEFTKYKFHNTLHTPMYR